MTWGIRWINGLVVVVALLVNTASSGFCDGDAFASQAIIEPTMTSDSPAMSQHGELLRRTFLLAGAFVNLIPRLAAQQAPPARLDRYELRIKIRTAMFQKMIAYAKPGATPTPALIEQMTARAYWSDLQSIDPTAPTLAAAMFRESHDYVRHRGVLVGLSPTEWTPIDTLIFINLDNIAQQNILSLKQERDPKMQQQIFMELTFPFLFDEQHYVANYLRRRRSALSAGAAPIQGPSDFLLGERLQQAIRAMGPQRQRLLGPAVQKFCITLARAYGPNPPSAADLGSINPIFYDQGYVLAFSEYADPLQARSVDAMGFRIKPGPARRYPVKGRQVRATEVDAAWSRTSKIQNQIATIQAFTIEGMGDDLALVVSNFNTLAERIALVRNAPDASNVAEHFAKAEPVVKRVIDLVFPKDQKGILAKLIPGALYHELTHILQRLKEYANESLRNYFSQFTLLLAQAPEHYVDEYGGNLLMIIPSEIAYWHVTVWTLGLLAENRPVENGEELSIVFDVLLRSAANSLITNHVKPEFKEELQKLIAVDRQWTTHDGFRFIEMLLDSNVTNETLQDYVLRHYQRDFGEPLPKNILRAA